MIQPLTSNFGGAVRVTDSITPALKSIENPAWRKKAMQRVMMEINNKVLKEMTQTPKNPAVTYKRGKGYGAHHPSYAGNPPAVDTGTLRRSLRFWVEGDFVNPTGVIASTVAYAKWLETGTKKMQERPVWEKTTNDIIKNRGVELFGGPLAAQFGFMGGR